jgi:hypothetical protein
MPIQYAVPFYLFTATATATATIHNKTTTIPPYLNKTTTTLLRQIKQIQLVQ